MSVRSARGDWNYHVSPSINRASILTHGLDITRMSSAGIAGSLTPEVEGVFIARSLGEAFWLAGFDNHARVDLWSVDARGLRLLEHEEGFFYYPGSISPARLRLVEGDVDRATAAVRRAGLD